MNKITILISTSPRPTHPSPRILDQTIRSAREQLPNAPIIIMADGLPLESDRSLHVRYSGFLNEIRGQYDNATVLTHETHQQQSGMLEMGMSLVDTPLILYLEDDWSLHPHIEWEKLGEIIQSGYVNYVRLYAYCRIHPLHEGHMLERVIERGIPLIRTTQWSQNPHLASTSFYRNQVVPLCRGRVDAIENIMHGPCGCEPWEMWRLCIYNPENAGTTQTCQHLDGRQQ
jgi:hypothetical protein